MAKKTLESILECPIDFIYLWATDDFISQLGNKASIIRSKKYNQYQTLWKTMVENVKSNNRDELIAAYNEWLQRIAAAIEDVYGMKPEEILQKLALGKDVLGKNWRKGVYGISGNVVTTFSQNSAVTVDTTTGKIMVDGVEAPGQTPIYGEGDGETASITGYSYYDAAGNVQYQSGVSASGQYGAVCYTNSNGTQKATGGNFDPSTGSFWQNANNYMPIVTDLINWLKSVVDSLLGGNRVVLQPSNTVPEQTEWVETESNSKGLWIAGAAAAVGLVLFAGGKKRKKD